MLLNGAIDRDFYGVDFKRETYGKDDTEISFVEAFKIEVRVLGNVPIIIDGNIPVSLEDESFCFENIAGLDYTKNKSLQWNDAGIVGGDYRIEVMRWFLVKKPQ